MSEAKTITDSEIEKHADDIRLTAEIEKKKAIIGKRLRVERKNRGLTLEQVAKMMNTTHQTVSNLEKGTLRMTMLFRYANALGLGDVWFNLDTMMPEQEAPTKDSKPSQVRHRIRVGKKQFKTPHVVSTLKRYSTGEVKDYNITTVELSKTYWSSLSQEKAETLCRELCETFTPDTATFKVEKYTP